jgi:hypothetical protein
MTLATTMKTDSSGESGRKTPVRRNCNHPDDEESYQNSWQHISNTQKEKAGSMTMFEGGAHWTH